jgi:hypothetical protein
MAEHFAFAGQWALGADELQWILYKRHVRRGGRVTWDGVSFVRSERLVLERCMREKGVSGRERAVLLAGLPDSFDDWKGSQPGSNAPVEPSEAPGALEEVL